MYDANTNWSNESAYLNNLISSGSPGQQAWAQNQLGVLNSAKAALSPVSINESIGNFSNALDMITGLSEKSSARSLEYARQHQDWSANQAAIANQYNAAEAAKNRDWQEYMSNTAHQREVADLKAAGLNPVLAAMGGNGASVGSGAAASAAMPSGSAGQSDTSANNALVSILGSMLSAQTAIQNQLVSAKTQEAVADKYTAMSELTAQIAAGASMYASDKGYQIQQDFPNSLIRIVDSMMSGTGTSWPSLGGKVADILDGIISKLQDEPQSKGFIGKIGDTLSYLKQVRDKFKSTDWLDPQYSSRSYK